MKANIFIFIIFLSLPLSVFSQGKNATTNEQISRAKEIIENARKETGADKFVSNLDSFQLTIKSVGDIEGTEWITTKEASVMLPDKIFSVYSTKKPFESNAISIWNGQKYKKLFESVTFNGQRLVKDVTNQDLSSNFTNLVKDKETLEKIKRVRAIDPKVRMNDELWSEIFPLILTHPFESQAEFKFVGQAKSADRTANVVDTISANGREIRLLFDSETHHLLMMIEKYKGFDGEYETKYYYSDRELTDNILIPKKIKVEHKYTQTGKEAKITYKYLEVAEFKINPKFKSNLFDIN